MSAHVALYPWPALSASEFPDSVGQLGKGELSLLSRTANVVRLRMTF